VNSPVLATVVDRSLLFVLQRARGYPSVSVLLTTTPGPALSRGDVVRLRSLLARAERRLADELPAEAVETVTARLRHVAGAVRRAPAQRALALYASESHAVAVQLAVPVGDRVVVDPTFATRDLVRSWRATPRYRLLVLSSRAARLFEGRSTRLHDVTARDLPAPIVPTAKRRDRSHRFGREPSRRRDAVLRAHLKTVAVALTARHFDDPLPLVVAGGPRQLALFREVVDGAVPIAGEIRGNHERAPVAPLAARCLAPIERHRDEIARTALARLESVRDRARVAEGIDDVWGAAVEGRVALLCVEESFTLPARVLAGGRQLVPAGDVEHPDVLDDAVDELIELVAARGGETVLVGDGALAGRGRVAALVQDPRTLAGSRQAPFRLSRWSSPAGA
jgi:hypothetical protein